jgi:starch synthase
LAHRLQAGADILLAPARYEPCGLTQLYALRYGTVPVVRRTGGLADTVTDARSATLSEETATGFAFEDPSRKAFGDAIERALRMYREPLLWRRLQLAGMKRESGWKVSALEYLSLYEEASGLSRPRQKGYSQGGELSQREVRSAQGWT